MIQYVCMCVCMYMCMYEWCSYNWEYPRNDKDWKVNITSFSMNVYRHMHVCICLSMYDVDYNNDKAWNVDVTTFGMYVCMYVCMYACMYVYVYV
jgi:hypothetical protein